MHQTRDMYSRARVAGHPIHPMVVALPIGLFVTAVAAMLAFVGASDPFFYRAAMYAAFGGVVTALVAALPGVIDLIALPAGSRVRRTALKHGSVALFATGLFAVSAALLYRGWTADAPLEVAAPLAVALAGLVALVIVGALGWSLVQTHHVGVKPIVFQDHSGRRALAEEYDDFSTPPVGLPALREGRARHLRH